MLKRTLLPLAILGVLLVAGGYAVAQKRMDHGGNLDRLKEHLSLTDAQVTQVQAIFKAHHDAAEPLFTEMRTNHEALKTALNAPEPNATDVGKLVIADNALKAKMRHRRDSHP